MAIVSPLPVPATPLKEILVKPYAVAICAGVNAPAGGPPPPMGSITNVGWAAVAAISARDSRRSIPGFEQRSFVER
jgi:hypothetical protein